MHLVPSVRTGQGEDRTMTFDDPSTTTVDLRPPVAAHTDVDALLRVVAAAEAAEVEAETGLAAAEARVADVAEQRAAAEEVLVEARRQLAALEAAGSAENDVRRSLERAGQAAREADAAAAAGRQRVERCSAEVAAAAVRSTAAVETLAMLRAVAEGDPVAVSTALAAFEATPPPTDPGRTLEEAQRAATAARAAFEAARQPLEHVNPPWWDHLAALHAAVVDAESGLRGRFGRSGSQRRLEEAMAAERAFLVEIGQPSHLDALMSGGRSGDRRDPAVLEAATDALAEAEAEVGRVRAAHVAAAALTAALGVDSAPREVLAVLARAWLAEHRRIDGELAAAEAERGSAAGALSDRQSALAGARAALVDLEAAAADARHQVEVLEAELGNRVGPVGDLADPAAATSAMRDRIGALESRISSAEAEAAGQHAAAVAALAAATEALLVARRRANDALQSAPIGADDPTDHAPAAPGRAG